MTDSPAAAAATPAPAPPAPAPAPAPANQSIQPPEQQKKQPKQTKQTKQPKIQQNAPQPKQQHKQQQQQSKKKRKSDIMGPGPGTEQIKRLNFMLQAAHLLSHPATSAPHPFKRRGDHQRARPAMPALAPVGRHISRELVSAARKATLKLDPAVKRSMCKRCHAAFVPGVTCSVTVKYPKLSRRRRAQLAAAATASATAPEALPSQENDSAMDVDPPTNAPHLPAPTFKIVPATITKCHACGYERRMVHDPDRTLFHDRAQVSHEETMA
ncbi:hypothetical protein AMAG_09023 [Allomyces macrogynus ATCC 38327]|uniref:Rpr2-domain-containing protein n=1 Tax=Allomyces macrogynus (strain ATCC 38327) TaxID=578462 RepID=A0A0L0SN75_ALLM3|nr:hypothetical protein AMAG_09023 [Allomyces macrogynus ATCC 38327]|eukprot:KNE63961.1 hypothetical protein AMAG_09023 [Allomyces macrogynus ATCC 38327]